MLARRPGWRLATADPATGTRRYRLCAVFATDTARTAEDADARHDDEWSHAARRHRFDRIVEESRSQP